MRREDMDQKNSEDRKAWIEIDLDNWYSGGGVDEPITQNQSAFWGISFFLSPLIMSTAKDKDRKELVKQVGVTKDLVAMELQILLGLEGEAIMAWGEENRDMLVRRR
jgi:hypothetical protein